MQQSNNVNVANHYAIINHHRHLELERGEVSDGTAVNLAGTETPSGSGSNNNDDDNSAIEKIAQENAQKIAAAKLDQAKTNLEEAAAANPNENIYTGGGPMGGFKKGGLVNKKKK